MSMRARCLHVKGSNHFCARAGALGVGFWRTMRLCKDCGGANICKDQRIRSQCKNCGGPLLCEHQRRRSYCKDCGSGAFCEHQRRIRGAAARTAAGRNESKIYDENKTHDSLPNLLWPMWRKNHSFRTRDSFRTHLCSSPEEEVIRVVALLRAEGG